ncbi:CRISPR-associated endonuclease Cas2 [Staphylospora marina]|uniref:CRISPR-associated endonuclease Cas2 n=1 Tax=Staphylospora marina TaxID=2490858 RepID=UPI000F5BA62A|nr:CRISPR-associated endonuclease Cas2 [Staphylospora marina]
MKRVVCYDVIDDRRRNKVFKLLKDYGQRVQYSVFEVECDEENWLQLEFRLVSLLDEDDSLSVYTLCQSCTRRAFYKGSFTKRLEEDTNPIL